MLATMVCFLGQAVRADDFIRDGVPVDLDEQSGEWATVDGFLGGKDIGGKLVAGKQVGPGDFAVRAELALDGLAKSAAALKLGGSYFGFAGGHGKIYLTGALFDDASGLAIGEPADFMTDGKPFVVEAIREGRQLKILIDGKLVHEHNIHDKAIGEVGLMPGRAKMKVRSFSATGGLGEHFKIPMSPPYRAKQVAGVEKNRLLAPGPGNARNSEGDFIELKDGRLLFIYSHFTGGGSDHATGHLAGRYSSDGGRSWTDESVVIVPQSGGFNDMSVSLLRLQDGRIALFYARKNSMLDCRPVMRISADEAKTWGEPVECITDEIGYYVLNNDRVIQLEDGRLIMAVALHNKADYKEPNWKGHIMCYLSDDAGKTWRRSTTILAPEREDGSRLTAQEPGLVELKDGRLMMFIRSDAGSQMVSYSEDRGETWSEAQPSEMISPVSPATIERIPSTGDLLLAWNNHRDVDAEHKGKRTPFAVAISKDEGKTWTNVRTLEDDVNGWYCYIAMDFVDGHVLLGHCAGDRRRGGLNLTQMTRFPIDWLYGEPDVDAVRVEKDVNYLGDDRTEKMDLYLPPESAGDGPFPAVLIVHGGGWHGGAKAAGREQNIGTELAKAGFVCASIDYQLAEKKEAFTDNLRQVWPGNVQDCMTAVRYLRERAEDYGIDDERIGAIGGSAGGHLVAMLGTLSDADGLDPEGRYAEHSARVQAVVPMYGAHDLQALAVKRGMWEGLSDEDKELCRVGSPVTYLDSDDPPLLILHGTDDALVPVEQSQLLQAAAEKEGVESSLNVIEGAPHSFHLQPKQEDLREQVIGFFTQHLKRDGQSE